MTLSVLVVDDNPQWRELLRLCCELDDRFGPVSEALDGDAAVRAADRDSPDAIVLDLDMPDASGLDALPALRAVVPGACIVAFSTFPGETHARLAYEAGADAYVEKGDEVPALLDCIVELCSGRTRAEPSGAVRALRRMDWDLFAGRDSDN